MSWDPNSHKVVPGITTNNDNEDVDSISGIGLVISKPKAKPKTLRYIKDQPEKDNQDGEKFCGFVFGFKTEDGTPAITLGSEYMDKKKISRLCHSKKSKKKTLSVKSIHEQLTSTETDAVQSEIPGEVETVEEKKVFVFLGSPEEKTPVDCPPIFGTTDEILVDYFEKYNLKDLMEYLLGLVSLHSPENPYEFISTYADKMIKTRNNESKFLTLPRIFTEEDCRAMYRLLDKQYRRKITLAQYNAGMESLGLIRFNPEPHGSYDNGITEETFCNEAWEALESQLKSFIGPH